MASFFDDEAEDDAYARRSDDEHAVYNARAGPSRRPASDTGQDNDRRSPSPPPPLAGGSKQTTSTSHDKGKARAINHNNGNPQRHARASSTMSIDLDINTRNRGYNNTTTGVGQTRRRDRGFLADEEDDADITLNTTHRGRAGNEVQDETIDDDNGNNESDIQHLMRLYMDERMSPELLSFPEELIASLMQNLEAQTEAASVLLSSGLTSKAEEHERLLLVQMEIERVRWLLRSYLRTRTYKIEKQVQYLLKTPLALKKLSEIEIGFTERYQNLLLKHFNNSVVGNIPERLGRLDEDEMIVRPDLDQAVFARARKDCPPIVLPDQQVLEMRKGEIHLVRYKSVRRLVRDGDVRLV